MFMKGGLVIRHRVAGNAVEEREGVVWEVSIKVMNTALNAMNE